MSIFAAPNMLSESAGQPRQRTTSPDTPKPKNSTHATPHRTPPDLLHTSHWGDDHIGSSNLFDPVTVRPPWRGSCHVKTAQFVLSRHSVGTSFLEIALSARMSAASSADSSRGAFALIRNVDAPALILFRSSWIACCRMPLRLALLLG